MYYSEYDYIIDFILNTATLILSILIQLITLFHFIQKSKQKQPLYASILLILNINVLMQVTFPTIFGFIFSFSYERQLGISAFGMFETVFFNSIYITCFLIVFLYKKKNSRLENNYMDNTLDKNVLINSSKNESEWFKFDFKYFFFVIIGIYLLIINFSVAGIVQSVAEIAGEVEKSYTFFDKINIYLRTMFEWTALATSVIFLFTYKGSKLLKFIVLAFCIGIIIRQLAMGLRGGIYIFIMLILFVSYIKKRSLNFRFIIPLIIILIPIFSFLGGEFRQDISYGQLIQSDTFERIGIITNKLLHPTPKIKVNTKKDDIFNSLYIRLEATRNSFSLVNLFDEGKGVNFRPTISSIRAFVPQQVTGIRNFPASSTNNAYGTAMHVVREKTYGTSEMGPYLASAHEYWEGGIVYLVFSAILLGLIWRLLSKWSIKRGYDTLSLIILLSLLDAHHGEMSVLAPLALIIRLFWYQILPIIIITYLINYMIKQMEKKKAIRLNKKLYQL